MATISQNAVRRINQNFPNTNDRTTIRGIIQQELEEQEMILEQTIKDENKKTIDAVQKVGTDIKSSLDKNTESLVKIYEHMVKVAKERNSTEV